MSATKTKSKRSTATTRSSSNNTPAENQQDGDKSPGQDLMHYLKEYAREQPGVAAAWCFGIGFIVGWRLKPW